MATTAEAGGVSRSPRCGADTYSRAYDKVSSRKIPAMVHLIGACRTNEKASEVGGERGFENEEDDSMEGSGAGTGAGGGGGGAGHHRAAAEKDVTGACTQALFDVIYPNGQAPPRDDPSLTWSGVLLQMRQNLQQQGYVQVPQLRSSRKIVVKDSMDLVPPPSLPQGQSRALLLGINHYRHEAFEDLGGSHEDVYLVKDYLVEARGFDEENVTIILEDSSSAAAIHNGVGKRKNLQPTRDTILAELRRLVFETRPGDTIFCHFSGHGAQLGEEEYILPVDAGLNGHQWISSNTLFHELVRPLPENVTLTFLMDCCHSGNMLNLPYNFVGGSGNTVMDRYPTAMTALGGIPLALLAYEAFAATCCVTCCPSLMCLCCDSCCGSDNNNNDVGGEHGQVGQDMQEEGGGGVLEGAAQLVGLSG